MKSFLLTQIKKAYELKPGEIEQILTEALSQNKELWEQIVTGAYLDGEISLSKAAELFGLHPVELRREFLKAGIPVKLGPQSLDEAYAEWKALEALSE